MNKTRLGEFLAVFQHQNNDLKGWPVKETAANLGLYTLILLITAVYVALGICQVAVSLIQALADLIAKGLSKAMPAPKEAKHEEAH